MNAQLNFAITQLFYTRGGRNYDLTGFENIRLDDAKSARVLILCSPVSKFIKKLYRKAENSYRVKKIFRP